MSEIDRTGVSTELRLRLRAELVAVRRAGDTVAASAIRIALAAIENAEAVPMGSTSQTERHLAGATSGDAARRVVDDAEAQSIVLAEIEGMRAASTELHAFGRHASAGDRARQAEVLESILGDGNG